MSNTNTAKPNLLLIAGYFPPVRISTGSIRPWNLTRCLINLGWNIGVVTPKISVWDPKYLDNVENVKKEIEEVGINMIYTDHYLKCLAPSRYLLMGGKVGWFFGGILRVIARKLSVQNWVGWVPSALQACKEINPDTVDVILATGGPFWGFEIAYQLSKRWKKPFVMDYRDLWTDNPWTPVKAKWVVKQEKRLVSTSSAITIVSPISGEVLSKKFNCASKITTITNGYDRRDLSSVKEYFFDHFAIIFAGMVIPPKLTLSTVFKALCKIKQQHSITPAWKFHYFGPSCTEVMKEVTTWGLEDNSIIHGNIPRKEVLAFIKGASLNLVISSNSPEPTMEDKGVIPGKIFELIGMGCSILPIVPKESAVEEISKNIGIECFSHNELDEIANYILECMNGRKVKVVNREKYSWEELSKRFDILLRSLIDHGQD